MARNNFDFLRLLFASMVMLSHTAGITAIPALLEIKPHIAIHMAVEGFFIISGYLIFMSYDRSTSLSSYVKKRANRILPAYIFVIIGCALFFSFLSTYTFTDYFFSMQWWQYLFSNLIFANFLQPSLPGVFENGAVNGSLWTIKIEVMFYFCVPVIAYLFMRLGKGRVILSIYVLSAIFVSVMSNLYAETLNHIYFVIKVQLPGQLMYFISGAFLYYFKENFEKYKTIIFIMAVVGFGISDTYNITFLYPMSYAVLIIYFALYFKYLGNFGRFGDLSYGVYIYHFPLAKAFVALNIINDLGALGYLLLIVSIIALSYFSWHFIEKPFLRKKSHYKTSENT